MVLLNRCIIHVLCSNPDKMQDSEKCFILLVITMFEVSKLKISVLWLHCPLVWNRIMHSKLGNIRHGYRIASWNCRKGLMLQDNTSSPKLDDIKSFLVKYDIHVFG